MSKKLSPPINSEILEMICKVIADTNKGLTGTEIAKKLGDTRIPDIDPMNTKWKRLYNCLLYTSPSPRDRTRSRMPSSA